MTELKITHILMLAIVAFVLYNFMGGCNCGNGFSIGCDIPSCVLSSSNASFTTQCAIPNCESKSIQECKNLEYYYTDGDKISSFCSPDKENKKCVGSSIKINKYKGYNNCMPCPNLENVFFKDVDDFETKYNNIVNNFNNTTSNGILISIMGNGEIIAGNKLEIIDGSATLLRKDISLRLFTIFTLTSNKLYLNIGMGYIWDTEDIISTIKCTYPEDGFTYMRSKDGKLNRCADSILFPIQPAICDNTSSCINDMYTNMKTITCHGNDNCENEAVFIEDYDQLLKDNNNFQNKNDSYILNFYFNKLSNKPLCLIFIVIMPESKEDKTLVKDYLNKNITYFKKMELLLENFLSSTKIILFEYNFLNNDEGVWNNKIPIFKGYTDINNFVTYMKKEY